MNTSRTFPVALMLVLCTTLAACSDPSTPDTTAEQSQSSSETVTEAIHGESVQLTVYKSPTCGCCADWITHMEDAGFEATIEHPQRMGIIKQQLGITPETGSCHTAVSKNGYVFEGHVPAKLVQRFLDNPPENALGLAVPRMPVGSPGMEMGERFDPYDVILLKEDGGTEVYARIESANEQY